jgi:hypothetical protein
VAFGTHGSDSARQKAAIPRRRSQSRGKSHPRKTLATSGDVRISVGRKPVHEDTDAHASTYGRVQGPLVDPITCVTHDGDPTRANHPYALEGEGIGYSHVQADMGVPVGHRARGRSLGWEVPPVRATPTSLCSPMEGGVPRGGDYPQTAGRPASESHSWEGAQTGPQVPFAQVPLLITGV